MAKPKYDEAEIVRKLLGKIPVIESLKDVEAAALALIKKEYPAMGATERAERASEIASYDEIEELMEEPGIEDIMINGLNPIHTYGRNGMVRTGVAFESHQELLDFAQKLLLFSGKTVLKPINDLHLPGGARVNIAASPMGLQITIRRFLHEPPSVIDLISWGVLDHSVAAQLWMYAEGLAIKPANILIIGPPAAGKTTLLNALFSFFPKGQRTVVIEDTMELNTGSEENCARLVTNDGTTMEDLVRNSLRMRPDRIVVGEVRGAEAKDLMSAMNIGKICLGTLHAGTSREAVTRLENEPMGVPVPMIPLIDVIIVVSRFYQKGKMRRVITEISETAGIEGRKVLLSELYKFSHVHDTLEPVAPSVIYRDRLAETAGVSPKDIMGEIETRAKILMALQEKGIRSLEAISEFCRRYYKNPDSALAELGYKR